MTEPPGIIACAAVADHLRDIEFGADLRAISSAIHESPIDPGDDDAVTERVQAAVDALSRANRERIVIGYARSGDGLARVRARSVPLVVWRVDDCVAALRYREGGLDGDGKAPRTYYLTPGHVDRGLDPYKLIRAYRGTLEGLVEWFDAEADEGASVTWPTLDRLPNRLEEGADPPMISTFRSALAYFERVVLLDDGRVSEHHRAYAARFAAFLDDLRDADEAVGRSVEPADAGLLEAMVGMDLDRLATDDGIAGFVEVVPPDRPIGRFR